MASACITCVPRRPAPLIHLRRRLGDLAARRARPAGQNHHVDQHGEPDEAVGDRRRTAPPGSPRARRLSTFSNSCASAARAAGHQRDQRGQRDQHRLPGCTSIVVMARLLRRSSASRRSVGQLGARPFQPQAQRQQQRPHQGDQRERGSRTPARMRGSSVGTTVVLRVHRAPDVDALVDQRHVDRPRTAPAPPPACGPPGPP